MLLKQEREHLNAIIKIGSDRAQRIESLNKMALEDPIIYDTKLQKETIGEALELAHELREIVEEMVGLLEKDLLENLEVMKE
jgi:hypothetical protein